MQNIEDVYQFLAKIPTFKAEGKKAANFSLERFKKFCGVIDDPQNRFSSIHVAGSNGKGSTCQLIASIYSSAGYEVGVYTSPHILSYRERFTINGQQIDESSLVDFFDEYEALIKSFRLTYFEIATAVAFWWFARRRVDVAIIETGLGGRLDATNIITPLASVITTITLDHTDILGDTIEAITAEKAGIIKHKVPVVLGNIPEKAVGVIRQTARKRESPVFKSMESNPRGKNGLYHITENGEEFELKSTMQTPVQAYNIAMAWMLTHILRDQLPVTDEQRRQGIENVGALYPNIARFERLDTSLNWYFDGAHNLQAVQAMKNMVQTVKPVDETILILSLMVDKINKKMMLEFSEFKKIIYYTLPLERAATTEEVRQWLPHVKSFPANQQSAITLLKEFESELVIFAGSFYFYTKVRDWLSLF